MPRWDPLAYGCVLIALWPLGSLVGISLALKVRRSSFPSRYLYAYGIAAAVYNLHIVAFLNDFLNEWCRWFGGTGPVARDDIEGEEDVEES